MSKIEQLLKKLCPDGVEYKPLGEVLDYEQPTKYIVKSTDYDDSYETPVLTAGQTFVLGYTNESDNHYKASKSAPVIIFDDFTTAFQWVDFEFKVKSSAMKMLTPKNEDVAGLRYLFYAMQCINYIPVDHSRHWIEKYSKFEIPLPPIEIQREVVEILDKFAQLEAELEAELAKRKKQYEHYRDIVLDVSADQVELGSVIKSLNTGLNPRKFFRLNTDDAENYYVTIREMHGGRIEFSDKTDRINDEALRLCNHRSNLEAGDVLFSGTGTIGEMVVIEETPRNWNIKEGVYTIKPDQSRLLPKYLRYILMSSPVRQAYMSKIAGGTVKSIPMGELKKVKIPLPPLAEQERIVGILDRFDALCNSLSEGLPAEIERRKKQYAFYRDKLLAFRNKNGELRMGERENPVSVKSYAFAVKIMNLYHSPLL